MKSKKVIFKEDCGNAPKKLIIFELYQKIINNDESFLEYLKDDIIWDIKGREEIKGLENFLIKVKSFTNNIKEIRLYEIITHVRVAAANGIIELESGKLIDFADTFKFNNSSKTAKISVINSYYIL